MTEPTTEEPTTEKPVRKTGLSTRTVVMLVVVSAVLIGSGVYRRFFYKSAPESPAKVAVSAGARSCVMTEYTLTQKRTRQKPAIYDCRFRNGSDKCVIDEDGVVDNVTAETQLLLKRTPGTTPPTCAA